ncbi:MAG TPA: hypothetical protein VKU00_01990, partial [Chthonomonadaceae bacterium]|nr:hypothetical protein [Chthonomonadaceae bacterium]
QQEIAAALADTLAALYAFDSVALRIGQMPEITPTLRALATVMIYQNGRLMQELASTDIPPQRSEDDSIGNLLPVDTVQNRRNVATAVLERGGYPW